MSRDCFDDKIGTGLFVGVLVLFPSAYKSRGEAFAAVLAVAVGEELSRALNSEVEILHGEVFRREDFVVDGVPASFRADKSLFIHDNICASEMAVGKEPARRLPIEAKSLNHTTVLCFGRLSAECQ